jgi:hypothetical protein
MKKILPLFVSSLCLFALTSTPGYAEGKHDHGDHHEHKHEKHHDHADEHKHEEHKHEEHHDHEHKHEEHDEMEQHGSHEHGVAKLMVAATESGLELILDTPAANVFGFEHHPETEEQQKQVELAKAKLADATTLFTPNKEAECEAENSTIHSPLLEKTTEEKMSHSDVEAHWAFNCQQTDKLENINVTLFSAFPEGFERLQVEWITSSGASATELTEDGIVSLK